MLKERKQQKKKKTEQGNGEGRVESGRNQRKNTRQDVACAVTCVSPVNTSLSRGVTLTQL